MTLPEEDRPPLEPSRVLVPLSPDIVAAGREVVALPCVNPALSPTLDVVGFPGMGWDIRVKDGFGTPIFSVMLEPGGHPYIFGDEPGGQGHLK